MQAERDITFADITRAVETRDPQLAELVIRFVEQPDPAENAPEDPPLAEDDETLAEPPPLPDEVWTLKKVRQTLSGYGLQGKTATERKVARSEAWEGILAAPYPPPRLKLARLLIDVYEAGDEDGRAALMEIYRRAQLGWGVWKAFKTTYKLAEARHDAELFGVLAWRLDAMSRTSTTSGEVSSATFTYMRRRAWRYLRQLGQAVPELFPLFAAQVLRHYPRDFRFQGCWVAHQLWAHEDLKGTVSPPWFDGPPKELKKRAFHESWKQSAEPLLRLLEDADNDAVCRFAIKSLQGDFADTLRDPNPRWLERIGQKGVASVDEFVVKLLSDSPELHGSKLAKLGLHEMALGLLRSESSAARKYAIDYAAQHAPNIPLDELLRLALEGAKEVQELAGTRLAARTPQEIGLGSLVRLLGVSALEKLAAEKLRQGFSPGDLEAEHFIALYSGSSTQKSFVLDFFKQAKLEVPATFYCQLLDDPRGDNYSVRRDVLKELGKRSGEEISLDWVKTALLGTSFSNDVARWLRSGKWKGAALDVDWLKGLVLRPTQRALALELLGNTKLVEPRSIGLAWLLGLARQADETLHQFAHRYLLEHFSPEDFAVASDATAGAAATAGIDRLWGLAAGPKEPEPVRLFAATYLRLHHPVLGPTLSEARLLGIKPRLKQDAYALARLRPLFADTRADVRRLAVAIGRYELVAWGESELLYTLADSRYREPRGLAAEALLGIDQPEADKQLVPPLDWLVAARVFALAESPTKGTREIALTLIRRHYARLGGAAKLAWLMESPDREVRLFAVRLLWEKHRPHDVPSSWQPKKGKAPELPAADERFGSLDELRLFLRTVLFGLPPGRLERRDPLGDVLPDRPLPASVAKRRLIGVVRDMGEADGDFAELVVPVLEEFAHSQAKGEWQGCVAALACLRHRHPQLTVSLPQSNL